MSASEHAEQFDLLVIGAGIAGASAALSAARALRGTRRVLLVDHSTWPREKVCGCCLGSRGIASLQRLGFDAHSRPADYTALVRVRVTARGGASFDLPHAGGLVVNRSVLDSALVSAAVDAGATFRARCAARVVGRSGDAWRVRLGSRVCLARAVIVADGLAGRSLADLPGFTPRVERGSLMGAGIQAPAFAAPPDVAPVGTVLLAHGVGGYVGLVRTVNGSIDVAAAIRPQRVRSLGGPIGAMQRLLDDARVRVALDPDLCPRGTSLLTRRRDTIGGPGLIIAGDAAGYVEPFTGEGMTWAALAGEQAGALAAHAICGDTSMLESLGNAWSHWYRHELKPMQSTCRSIRLLLHTPGMLRGVANIAMRSRAVNRLLAQISTRVTGGIPVRVASMTPQLLHAASLSPTTPTSGSST